MIPIPSKKPFHYPVPPEALRYLTHPNPRHRFARPFRDAHGNIVTWNGALAVRIQSFLPDIETADTHWEAVENSLHWPDPDHEKKEPGRWRPLDDVAGSIWRFGAKSPWIECRDDNGRLTVTGATFSCVRVGASTVVPVGLLQLCARLPRCRVRIDGDTAGHLQFLFKGGAAVIRPINSLPPARFSILTPKRDLWTKSHVFTR